MITRDSQEISDARTIKNKNDI